MLSFNINTDDVEHTYLRPCFCTEDDGYIEKSFCYVEGTERDISISDNKGELTENVWYEIKPPRLFSKDLNQQLVTARQIYVTRVLLEGKRATVEDEEKPKEKASVSMNKKKSAVRFLSKVRLE